jgi:hypothetical protein
LGGLDDGRASMDGGTVEIAVDGYGYVDSVRRTDGTRLDNGTYWTLWRTDQNVIDKDLVDHWISTTWTSQHLDDMTRRVGLCASLPIGMDPGTLAPRRSIAGQFAGLHFQAGRFESRNTVALRPDGGERLLDVVACVFRPASFDWKKTSSNVFSGYSIGWDGSTSSKSHR